MFTGLGVSPPAACAAESAGDIWFFLRPVRKVCFGFLRVAESMGQFKNRVFYLGDAGKGDVAQKRAKSPRGS